MGILCASRRRLSDKNLLSILNSTNNIVSINMATPRVRVCENEMITNLLTKCVLKQPLSDTERSTLLEWQSRSLKHLEVVNNVLYPRYRKKHQKEVDAVPTEAMWSNLRE